MNNPATILLICAETNLRRSYTRILQKAGYQISPAANLQEGRGLLVKGKYDLIILGAQEPQLSPAEIVPALPPEEADTPLLFLTASPAQLRQTGQSGSDYLSQPLTPSRFLSGVASILARAAAAKI